MRRSFLFHMASLQEDTESQDEISSPVLATKYSLKEGHEITFVTEPPKEIQLECSICLQILSDPCMLDCKCGYSFCRECIESLRIRGNRCPLCVMTFSITLSNIRLDKALNELEIHCCNDNLGCKWTGELGSLSKHLNTQASSNRLEGCEYVIIQCSLCEFRSVRKEMANHEGQQCAERQYTCEYCNEYTSTFKDVYTNHWPVCGLFKQACERGGNYLKSDLDSTPSTVASQRLQYPSIFAHNMTEKTKAQYFDGDPIGYIVPTPALAQPETNERIQINGQRTWLTMNNFSSLIDSEEVRYSTSFYTHIQGYNMCLAIQHNRDKSGYLSVSTHILKGKYDIELKWPLQGEVTIKLVGQDSERSHSRVVEYTGEVEEECAGRVLGKGERSKGLGKMKFISYRNLYPNFIREDSLWFDVQCKLYV